MWDEGTGSLSIAVGDTCLGLSRPLGQTCGGNGVDWCAPTLTFTADHHSNDGL
jgi:hypothetical protein